MILDNWLYKRAVTQPDGCALVFEGTSWTFSQLFSASAAMSEEIATSLSAEGSLHQPAEEFSMPERVGLLCDNSAASYVTILALMNLRIQIVMLNTRLSPDELTYQVNDADLPAIVYSADARHTAQALAAANTQRGQQGAARAATRLDLIPIEDMWHAVNDALGTNADAGLGRTPHNPPEWVSPSFDTEDVMSILYTSGTTGDPKGVMQSFGNHLWSALSGVLSAGITPTDAWVCTVPLYHISGLSILVRGLVYGMPVYLFRKFDAHAVNDTLLSGQATIVSVVAYSLTKLVEDLDQRGLSSYPPQFRYMLLGGGFFRDSLLEACATRSIPVIRSFGMSETCSQIIATPLRRDYVKPGSSGVPLFVNQMRIAAAPVDRTNRTDRTDALASSPQPRIAQPGEIGEIQVKAPALCVGYLNKPEKYAASFTADGWYRTGDIGTLDEDGYLYVKSRLAEMIISGGENIFPSEVEAVIAEHPAVAEVAVVGHEDDVWGYVPWAYLVADQASLEGNPYPSDEELTGYIRERLAAYKVPKRFIWIDELPKTSIGKVQKFKLLADER
ncbi:MAG: o-succinylbenzoate--CoA ligase [Actinomycetaceae bacterium]|nr:o-succinylbenzoate--CoA ligase [Actinomycetaceae bacterium]MDY6082753.1 o-succinylbenzoate--CoA ligase [Actinomycetaceae bacterium]